jgi:hypothetical protein
MSKTLAEALLAVQADTPALQKNAINPHFRNRYISLDALMEQTLPVLNKHGVVLLQHPTQVEGLPALRTKLLHAASGEFDEDTMLLSAAKPDPQGQGSAITYARRYSLMSILGLVADEDDDGNAGSGGEPKAASRPVTPTAVPQAASEPASPPDSFFQPPPPREAPDDGDPKNVAVHFGKNAGKKLGELTRNQVKWYAENELRADASAADKRLKGAAITILETFGGRA